MNYYEHHIGDYAEATAHLSFVEDAAYCRLLRKYYATEKPLPSDVKAVQRLVAARSRDERAAVDSVLREFFDLREDGWHNTRADEELERYQAGEPEREVRRANEQLRLQRHREERTRLFQALHAVGISAPWNAPIAQLRELYQRHCNAPETPPETLQPPFPATEPATPATATHTPVSSLQYPDTNPNPVLAREERAGSEERRALGESERMTEFSAFWDAYPKGGYTDRHKLNAEHEYWNRRDEGVSAETLRINADAYRAQTAALRKTPFNPDRWLHDGHWRGPFEIPKRAEDTPVRNRKPTPEEDAEHDRLAAQEMAERERRLGAA